MVNSKSNQKKLSAEPRSLDSIHVVEAPSSSNEMSNAPTCDKSLSNLSKIIRLHPIRPLSPMFVVGPVFLGRPMYTDRQTDGRTDGRASLQMEAQILGALKSAGIWQRRQNSLQKIVLLLAAHSRSSACRAKVRGHKQRDREKTKVSPLILITIF